MQDTKLSQADVVSIIKCLDQVCSVEATADICEVDILTVQRFLENSGKLTADFHRLQLEKLDKPFEAVQMNELHDRTIKNKCNIELVNIHQCIPLFYLLLFFYSNIRKKN